MQQTIDSGLVLRLRENDLSAYEELFNRYSSRLYNFAKGYIGSHPIAEEIVQDAFLKIWEKRKEIKAEESFKAYLFTITFNLVRKYFLKKSREEKYKQIFTEEFLLQQDDEAERIIYDELMSLLDQTIDKLPERRREIFIYSRKEELSISEIAEKLNISSKTVKNQLSEAIKFIREELKKKNNPGTILFYFLFVK